MNQVRKQSAKLHAILGRNNNPHSKHTKFVPNQAKGSSKREFSIGNVSLRKRNSTSISQLDIRSRSSSQSTRNILKNPISASKKKGETNFNVISSEKKQKQKEKKVVQALIKQVTKLLAQFKNLMGMIEREIQRSVDNAMVKLEKELINFLSSQILTQEKAEQTMKCKKQINSLTSSFCSYSQVSSRQQKEHGKKNQLQTAPWAPKLKKFPVIHTESLTTTEKEILSSKNPNSHKINSGLQQQKLGQKKSNSLFSNQIKLRQDIVNSIHKKLLFNAEQRQDFREVSGQIYQTMSIQQQQTKEEKPKPNKRIYIQETYMKESNDELMMIPSDSEDLQNRTSILKESYDLRISSKRKEKTEVTPEISFMRQNSMIITRQKSRSDKSKEKVTAPRFSRTSDRSLSKEKQTVKGKLKGLKKFIDH